MTIQLIDTHAHLHIPQFGDDRAAAIARAHQLGVVRTIEIGFDLESSRQAIAFAEQFPNVNAVVGIQPHYADHADQYWLEQIRQLATHPKVAAIGEIGLDYYHDRASHPNQEQLFRQQLALARELQLAVVIHSRDAHADTVRILQDAARGQPGVMHSFSGDWAFAEACLEVGFYLSFSGPLTFSKALDIQAVARRAPLDRLLIETDSPYLTPHPHRGKRNEPAYVRHVAEKLAELRGMTLEQLAPILWENTHRVFRITPTTAG